MFQNLTDFVRLSVDAPPRRSKTPVTGANYIVRTSLESSFDSEFLETRKTKCIVIRYSR